MGLSERKKRILQCVVDEYISTAQPVSSKSITEKYLKDVSSATVRSELSGLEEMGYLSQPHTSSGRIPSVEAYKLYVTDLMEKSKLTQKEVVTIKNAFNEHTNNLEAVVKNAVKVISELTDYTSVAYTSHNEKDTIVKIDIFRYKQKEALLLIVTENTLIRDKFIEIPEKMTDAQIEDAKEMLSRLFIGKAFGEIISFADKIKEEFSTYREIFDGVMHAIEDYLNNDKSELIINGENKILHHSEYSDTEKVKNFLSVVTDKEKITELMANSKDDIEISIKIGGEDGDKSLKDCSVVTASYSASGINLGTYGVIGPLRMDYQKVVSVLKGVGKVLEDIIKENK